MMKDHAESVHWSIMNILIVRKAVAVVRLTVKQRVKQRLELQIR